MQSSGTSPQVRPPGRDALTSAGPSLRWALVAWMVNHRPVDHVDVPLPTVLSRHRAQGAKAASVERWPIDEVLRALRDDPTPAPPRVTVLLGLPSGTSFGRVAQILQRARATDPTRPWTDLVLGLACRPQRGVGRETAARHRTPAGGQSRSGVVADRP